MVLLVTYDLHNPTSDYQDVIATLKTAGSWCHPQGSVWLLDTSLSPSDWVGKLRTAGDANDEYFAIQLVQHWHSANMDADAIAWLKSPARSW